MATPQPGAANMANYRLYCLVGDGRISPADWIEASSVEEAISKARKLRPDPHRCEVWRQERLVARLNEQGRFERAVP
jgi:hypothetical protein